MVDITIVTGSYNELQWFINQLISGEAPSCTVFAIFDGMSPGWPRGLWKTSSPWLWNRHSIRCMQCTTQWNPTPQCQSVSGGQNMLTLKFLSAHVWCATASEAAVLRSFCDIWDFEGSVVLSNSRSCPRNANFISFHCTCTVFHALLMVTVSSECTDSGCHLPRELPQRLAPMTKTMD